MTTLNLSNPLAVQQTIDGYRYSIEPFLLVNFANLLTGSRLLDIGTGCGIIPLLVTTQIKLKEIVAIEIQKSLYDLAINNILKNGVSDRVSLIHGNFIDSALDAEHSLFDTIISNPPYRKLNTGRMNPNPEKAVARHEISMDLNSLLTKTSGLLKHGGTFIMAYPPLRLKEAQEKLINDYNVADIPLLWEKIITQINITSDFNLDKKQAIINLVDNIKDLKLT